MKFDKLIGKRIILFTRKNYRFEGKITDFDGTFLELFDEVRKKYKNINIDNIVEFEVDNYYVDDKVIQKEEKKITATDEEKTSFW